jgi:signal peptidase II
MVEAGSATFIGIAVVVSIFLIKLILENRHKGEAIAYSLILGGAMGNLIDRVFRGYVVDSFDFYWRDWHWPAFNLADIAIVLGALLFSFPAACWVKSKHQCRAGWI